MANRKHKAKKRVGHYCWCCGRHRPNEQFSGKNHPRHLCKECARLGSEELAYRQGIRNIDQCLNWDGFVRRKQRNTFERFLTHANPRIRKYAEDANAYSDRMRQEHREELLEEEAEAERWYAECDVAAEHLEEAGNSVWVDAAEDEEIPF